MRLVCAQMMCSVLAASSAWPVLLKHRYLLELAADMVHSLSDQGPLPSLSAAARLSAPRVLLGVRTPVAPLIHPSPPPLPSTGVCHRAALGSVGLRMLTLITLLGMPIEACCRGCAGFPPRVHHMRELDVACVVAAACDLAVADAGFRESASAAGTPLAGSLNAVRKQAVDEFPRDPETLGLLALMDFQLTRAEAAGGHVRAPTPVLSVSCTLHGRSQYIKLCVLRCCSCAVHARPVVFIP